MQNKRITLTGVLMSVALVASWVTGLAARQLFPESALGSFLGTPLGLGIGIAGTWLAFVAISVPLGLKGYRLTQPAPETEA